MNLLDPTLDLVFKQLLTRQPSLLIDMLTGLLARPIGSVSILNPELPGELPFDKQVALDIRARLDDDSRVDLEMQRRPDPDLAERLVYYTARDYSSQLRRGDEYHLLKPTTGIAWLMEPLFPEIEHLHSIFELRERYTHTLLSHHFSIHLLQLSNLNRSGRPQNGDHDARVHRWARFLVAQSDAEFEQLAAENPIMKLAKQTLEQLSQEPETRRDVWEREEAIALYNMSLAASEARGRAAGVTEGMAKGMAKTLVDLLGLRFGRLPERVRVRIEAATVEQLGVWTQRVLMAGTPDEVFAS